MLLGDIEKENFDGAIAKCQYFLLLINCTVRKSGKFVSANFHRKPQRLGIVNLTYLRGKYFGSFTVTLPL